MRRALESRVRDGCAKGSGAAIAESGPDGEKKPADITA